MNILQHYVPDFHGQKVSVNGYDGYKNKDGIYFIIPKVNNETIHYEQKIISEYLSGSGFTNLASPILNQQGQLTTQIEQKEFIVCLGRLANHNNYMSHGQLLATFHRIGAEYPYAPEYISSYGQWKTLWQNKIDKMEQLYNNQIQERPVTRFQRLFIDTFPYIIGLAENALQYLQETELDNRFNESDQACFTFQRYKRQLQDQMIWSHELSYDHPTRDIAEYIRPFLLEEQQSLKKVRTFLSEYEQVRSLSIFGWRLLYARLLFPVHLFDFLERGLGVANSNYLYKDYKLLLEKHDHYEANVKGFFNMVGMDTTSLKLPVLDW